MKEIIIALDVDSFEKSRVLVDELSCETKWFKVGMEAYYSHGREILKYLLEKDLKVFLDLKLHDIPTTVKKSLKSILKQFPVDMINIHTLGGTHMMQEAAFAVKEISPHTSLIGVTILTSHSESIVKNELGISGAIIENVKRLAINSKEAGLSGIVCSATDLENIKSSIPNDFLFVTPGVRYQASSDDQVRVSTPKEAFEKGATHIVVGREVTLAKNPIQALQEIKESLNE